MGSTWGDEREAFERFLAENMDSAWNAYERRGHYAERTSQDAVTAWRKWGHILTSYCGDEPISLFMHKRTDTDNIARILARKSRWNRCRPDGTATLYADSIAYWVEDLRHTLESTQGAVSFARRMRIGDADARLSCEVGILTRVLDVCPWATS